MAERRSNMNKVQTEASQNKFNVWKNDLILKPGFRPIRLCWNGYTMVRFLPGLNPSDDYTTLDTFRYGDGYGTWIETVPVVMNMLPEVENGSISFVLPDSLDYEANFDCPYKRLWFALKRAIKNKVAKSTWKDLVIAGKFGTPLPQWKNFYFAYVNPYHADFKERDRDKNHPDRDIDPTEWSGTDILVMSASAYHALDSTLTECRDTCPVDLTDPAAGAFVAFFPEKAPCSFGNEIMRSLPGDAQFKGYSISIHDQYNVNGSRWNGRKPQMSEKLVQFHKAHAKPWESVFNIMSYDEQAEMLTRYMKGYEDLLCYAWEGTDWVTKELKDKANGLNQVQPTGYGQMGGYTQTVVPQVGAPGQTVYVNPNPAPMYTQPMQQTQSPVNFVTPTGPGAFDLEDEPPFQESSSFNFPGAASSRDMSDFDSRISAADSHISESDLF